MHRLEFDIILYVFGHLCIILGFVLLFLPQFSHILGIKVISNLFASIILFVIGILLISVEKNRIKTDLEEEKKSK